MAIADFFLILSANFSLMPFLSFSKISLNAFWCHVSKFDDHFLMTSSKWSKGNMAIKLDSDNNYEMCFVLLTFL